MQVLSHKLWHKHLTNSVYCNSLLHKHVLDRNCGIVWFTGYWFSVSYHLTKLIKPGSTDQHYDLPRIQVGEKKSSWCRAQNMSARYYYVVTVYVCTGTNHQELVTKYHADALIYSFIVSSVRNLGTVWLWNDVLTSLYDIRVLLATPMLHEVNITTNLTYW